MSENIATAVDSVYATADDPGVEPSMESSLPHCTSTDSQTTELPFKDSPGKSPSSDPVVPTSGRWQTTRRLYRLLRPFRGTISVLLLLSVGAVAIDLVPPLLQGMLVDLLVGVGKVAGSPAHSLLMLAAIVAGLLTIRVAATAVAIMKGRASNRVGATLTAHLRNLLVERLSYLPLAFHNRNQVGALMSRVAYDTETLHTLVYHVTGGILLQSLQLVGIGVMLFYLNAKLAIVTLLPMPFIAAGSWYFTRYLQPRYNHYWDAVGKQAGGLTGMLTGIRVVKTFVQEEREITRFNRASRYLCDSRQTVDGSIVTFTSIMGFVFASGGLAVWYIGGRDVLLSQMSVGSLVAFLAYLAMFYAPLSSIAESMSWFGSFFSTVDRIYELLETPMEKLIHCEPSGDSFPARAGSFSAPAGIRSNAFRGGVEFQNVSFAYDKSKPVLKEVSFSVAPGEMVGIVGRSGSGKSTMVSLMARLYEADAGKVFVGGVDTSTVSPRELRRHLGMVQQEPFLFRGSVLENISYGNTSAEPEEILLAARQADAHGFIMRLPFAYESQLGEGGAGLSGGERQRLSIARALLVDPDILILDEATASIDAESERAICAAIRRFSRRRTTIAIAHRLSTLRNADRLLVFDQGRLVEQGTHDELMAVDGLYASLVRLQYSSGPTEDEEDEATDLPWLDPMTTIITGDENGGLTVCVAGQSFKGVIAAPCYPATCPDAFISLRCRGADGRETELGIVRNVNLFPPAVRIAIGSAIESRHTLERIQSISQLRTRGPLLEMIAAMHDGEETLNFDKAGDGLHPFGRHGLLLTDRAGKRYVISDRTTLPKHQQQLLSLYFGEQI